MLRVIEYCKILCNSFHISFIKMIHNFTVVSTHLKPFKETSGYFGVDLFSIFKQPLKKIQ